jgi:hypothetical protein
MLVQISSWDACSLFAVQCFLSLRETAIIQTYISSSGKKHSLAFTELDKKFVENYSG